MLHTISLFMVCFHHFLSPVRPEAFLCPEGFSCSRDISRPGGRSEYVVPVPCSVGTYSQEGDGVCKPCMSGYYTLKNGSAACDPCPPGFGCFSPNQRPVPCSIGTYSSCAQQFCNPCPTGTYTVDKGSTYCIKCPAGTSCGSTTTIPNIPTNARWSPNGVTVAGGNGRGSDTNQLDRPHSLFVDDNQTIVIADCFNDRIIQWKKGNTNGQIVAGGKGQGSRLDQLDRPTDLLIDKESDSLIVCEYSNRRVVRWSRRSGTTQGEILIDNIACFGFTMDDQKNLYVSDLEKHEVRRYRIGEKNGTLVAGGNGAGAGLNQLNRPGYIFVDRQQAVYVSDWNNHRVMKWHKGATDGIVVAGGHGAGDALTQLSNSNGLVVDTSNTLYVVDYGNHRVLRWPQGASQGTIIVGGNGGGSAVNKLDGPAGLSFDRQGNIYVADFNNDRVQRFSIQ